MRKGRLEIYKNTKDGKRIFAMSDVTKVIYYDITRTVKVYQEWDGCRSETVFQIDMGEKIKANGISIKVM